MDEKKKFQTVSRWHPWQTKFKISHSHAMLRDGQILQDGLDDIHVDNVEQCISVVGKNMYCYVGDVGDILFSDELLSHPKTQSYIQKAGKIVAIKVKSGKSCGFIIPSRTWGFAQPGREMIETIRHVHAIFGHEAITPSSLSEAALRGTMPDRIAIFRPSADLRRNILDNSHGPRIDQVKEEKFYPLIWRYDISKAYLRFSRDVPDPNVRPWYHEFPDNQWLWVGTTGFWQVKLVAHGVGIHPIQIKDEEGERREPNEGEFIQAWLWTEELKACLKKGYTLIRVLRGYRWDNNSDILCRWADLLWDKYQSQSDDKIKDILKTMMVSFPGRCLREPNNHLLIPLGKQMEGDVPISNDWFHSPENWKEYNEEASKPFLSNWYLRSEYNLEDTALTPVGAYIIMRCRMEMYQTACSEEAIGNKLISTYVDCLSFEKQATTIEKGTEPGQYKEEKMHNALVHGTNVTAKVDDNVIMKLPGISKTSDIRKEILKRYHTMPSKHLTE